LRENKAGDDRKSAKVVSVEHDMSPLMNAQN
jgi:hypothetical protein